jgi:hypothetical protein
MSSATEVEKNEIYCESSSDFYVKAMKLIAFLIFFLKSATGKSSWKRLKSVLSCFLIVILQIAT